MHKTKPGPYEPFIPKDEFAQLTPDERAAQQKKFDDYQNDQEEAAALSGFVRPDWPSTLTPTPAPNYTDDEKTVIFNAILEAKFDLKEAYRLIALDTNMLSKDLVLRWDGLKSEPFTVLAGLLNRHGEDMWRILHSRYSLKRAAEIIESGEARVAADLIKYSADRSFGKPTQNITAEVITLSWSDIERRRQDAIKMADGEWAAEEKSTSVEK